VHDTLVQRASVEVQVIGSYDCVYYLERRGGHALSSGYGHIAALTSWEMCTLRSVSINRRESCLCIGEIRDCTANLGVVRRYFLADSHMRKLREE